MSKNSSLSHRVTSDLRRDIVAGVIEPGAWLKTEELAARYGVSANPVREALWRLQGEGFVVANPNQGARVRAVDDDFIRNIFEIREAIEPIFVRRFCQRATPADLDRLRVAAAIFAEVAADRPNDFEALEAANRDFHAVILEGEFNIPAIEAMERYAGIINATRAKLPVTLSHLRERVAQHRKIVEAVAAGDAEMAARVATEHVRAAGEDLLNLMRQARTIGDREGRFDRDRARAAKGAGRLHDLTRELRRRRTCRSAPSVSPAHYCISLWKDSIVSASTPDRGNSSHGAQRALRRRFRADFVALRRGLPGRRP